MGLIGPQKLKLIGLETQTQIFKPKLTKLTDAELQTTPSQSRIFHDKTAELKIWGIVK